MLLYIVQQLTSSFFPFLFFPWNNDLKSYMSKVKIFTLFKILAFFAFLLSDWEGESSANISWDSSRYSFFSKSFKTEKSFTLYPM